MVDTYKGESLQKKHARYVTHVSAKAWQSALYPGAFERGLHVFLASREGGDIGALHSIGVPWDNMLAADRCDAALKACHAKWTELLGPSEDDHGVHFVSCDDVATELGWIGHCLNRAKGRADAVVCEQGDDCWIGRWATRSGYPHVASAFLDFCAHLDKGTVDALTYAWSTLSYGSVLSVAVLKGREKRQTAKRATAAPHSNRRMRRASFSRHRNPALALVGRMVRGELQWDIPAALAAINEHTGGTSPAGARWLLVFYALCMCDSTALPDPLLVLEYQSKTKTSNGVPMLILSFGKRRMGQETGQPLTSKLTDAQSLEWRNRLLAEVGAEDAALLLNVDKRTAVAWKAHATRGTYAKEVA